MSYRNSDTFVFNALRYEDWLEINDWISPDAQYSVRR